MIKKEIDIEGNVIEDDGTVVIATKVTKSFYEKLSAICRAKGMKIYRMMRNCADTIVRYTDPQYRLTPEMEQAMQMFEQLEGWDKNFTLADPYAEPEVVEALYFLRDKKTKGWRAVHVERPFMGQWTQTFNVQVQMERAIELLQPHLYRKLRRLGADMGTDSVLNTLQQIILEREQQEDEDFLNGLFSDSRTEEGGKPREGGPYKRKMHKEVDSPGLFDNDEPNTEFRPFGGER